ncbi:MAG: dTDP-glucose 4,6-dehydratase [Bacteroidia bacterium]|nr:MAG: dTDP-glucose 4,6-dehydratase [Bacteroidia bacterium]
MKKTILITGGAGFIGSHLVRRMVKKYPDYQIVNIDALTYAGNLENLKDIENLPNYHFRKVDIVQWEQVKQVFSEFNPDAIIHLAAESHVDRSIENPMAFVMTNVIGTVNLLNAAVQQLKINPNFLFYHISTDEVFGSLEENGYFNEKTPYDPKSPYSASKASSDHFVRAYGNTYQLPYIISNCSNNYGPYQFPEKLIPLMIYRILKNESLPVYGKGENVRDWLWVEDHAAAIDLIFHSPQSIGQTFTIGGKNEWKNIDLVHLLCDLMDQKLNRPQGTSRKLITFVKDRAGHDLRYAIDPTHLENTLGWKPSITFEDGLNQTIDWYLQNQEWVNRVTSGEYQKYFEKQYQGRV